MTEDDMLARRLARELEVELGNMRRLQEELKAAPRSRDGYALRARASIVHDFYTAVERIFVRIAEELNGGVPRGDRWHQQLLEDMALELPGVRPAAVTEETKAQLTAYLRFRHVFRNVYGFVLEAERLSPLEEGFETVNERFVSEMRVFIAWLTGSNQA
jgi:hypothetical protein